MKFEQSPITPLPEEASEIEKQEEETPDVAGEEIEKNEKIENIESAISLDSLFKAIDETGGLQSSRVLYEPDLLKSLINRVADGELDVHYIMRTGGLRDKVGELLGIEKDGKKENAEAGVFGRAKEKISNFLEYKSLKLKEYFGKLTQEDFDRLLEFDFQQCLRDNPPIKDDIFLPEEELRAIRKLPKEEKREALDEFKEKLARQREALADLRVFIERSVEFNNDVPREKLVDLVYAFGDQYGFDARHKAISEKLIDGYYENREKVFEIRKKFPDNYELVKKLTTVNFGKDEKIGVSIGPMSIDIDVENNFDMGRLYEGSNNPVIAHRTYGFAAKSTGETPVNYIVVNNDQSLRNKKNFKLDDKKDDLIGKETRKHEYEHLKNKLFRAIFDNSQEKTVLRNYIGEKNPGIKKVALEIFFEERRRRALENLKDEITSQLYTRTLPQLRRQFSSLFLEKNVGSYDYLDYLRDWDRFKDDSFYQETAQKMLVKEYEDISQNAFDAYANLVEKGGYTTQEATALLTDQPLGRWPKVIKRLLDEKVAA